MLNGNVSGVWIAHDPDNDTVHLYDACNFKKEVLAVIAEGVNARGRWIPIGCTDSELSDQLLDRGCSTAPEKYDDSDSMAELISRDIWERMRSGRFKVEKRLKEWLDEFKTFNRESAKIPRDSHPLMAATRCAMAQLPYARAQTKTFEKNFVRRAIV